MKTPMQGFWHITVGFLLATLLMGFGLSASQSTSKADKSNSTRPPKEQTTMPFLAFSTYLGGSGDDAIRGVATDSQGNIYLTGNTASRNFPTTQRSYDRRFNGWVDIFVAKLDP